MSSMFTPGMSRFRAIIRRLLPFAADEADPALDDEGPIGDASPEAGPEVETDRRAGE